MKDTHLLPYILPNVFSISTMLSPAQFATTVLPSLKPLFSIKEPPQNMLTLLDNLGMLQSKTEKHIFRERERFYNSPFSCLSNGLTDVLPLVYNALESEHAIVWLFFFDLVDSLNSWAKVQERALKTIPDLCETIDYAEVQGVLFPRVAVRRACFFLPQIDPFFLLQLVFTKTRILSVKVATLVTFLTMVKTLDQVRIWNV